MTKADRELLLLLIVRPGMYVNPVEASTITSFITGYEVGIGNKSRFTKLVSDLISDKYKVSYSNDGWPGQIKLLARKRHTTWVIIFKKITLEVIVNAEGGSLTTKQQEAVKRKITTGIIDQAVPTGGPCFENWVEEWPALCDVKSSWFKQLWSRQEWVIIKAIDKLVQTNSIFEVEDQRQPSAMLLQLRERYAEAIGINPSSLKVC
jgi:hypothetical protein